MRLYFGMKYTRPICLHHDDVMTWKCVPCSCALGGKSLSSLMIFYISLNKLSVKSLAACGFRAPSQYPKKRLSVRKVSEPRDFNLELSDRSEISCTSTAVLPMCLSNFKAIRQFKVPISWLRDFTRSYEKTSFRILRRGPDSVMRMWRHCDKEGTHNIILLELGIHIIFYTKIDCYHAVQSRTPDVWNSC